MTIEIVSQIILKSKMPSRSQKELHHVSNKTNFKKNKVDIKISEDLHFLI